MNHQKADENHSSNESNSQSQRRSNTLSRQQLQEFGERELWVSAMTSWVKWPQLGYDGKIRMTLIRL